MHSVEMRAGDEDKEVRAATRRNANFQTLVTGVSTLDTSVADHETRLGALEAAPTTRVVRIEEKRWELRRRPAVRRLLDRFCFEIRRRGYDGEHHRRDLLGRAGLLLCIRAYKRYSSHCGA